MRSFRRFLLLSSLIAICAPLSAQEHAVASALRNLPAGVVAVHATNVDARRLIHLVAETARLNLVIGDELLDRRVDVDESGISPMALIERIAQTQDLEAKRVGDIVVVASACRLSQTPDVPILRSDQQRISMRYQHLAIGPVIGSKTDLYKPGIVPQELQTPFDSEAIDTTSSVSLSIHDQTLRDQLTAIAIAEGWNFQKLESGNIRIVPNAAQSACMPGNARHATRPEINRISFGGFSACPGSPPAPRCSILEKYEAEQLSPHGYLAIGGSRVWSALIELPYQEITLARVGDYLGRNFGKITRIDDSGISIVEKIQDDSGVATDKPANLPYR